MRLNGEIPVGRGEEDGMDGEMNSLNYSIGGVGQKLTVGYALTSKKKRSFLQPKFLSLARSKGICFIAIDLNRPLADQGPFDIVLHKLLRKEWWDIIEDYRQKHPEVTVLDPPNAIQHLNNRQSMLQDVADLNLSDYHGKVGVPRQLVVKKDPSSIPYEVTKAGLKLPLVAKPLLVDGSAKSHELFLAYDEFSLSELEPPLVLQEFVNHGGILFKIFIVGETITVVRRFSLPDVTNHELAKVDGVFRFPRVSCAAATADDAELDPSIAELPPRPLLERLVRELRLRLGIQLFNIDMIREIGSRDVFHVIDINYFPGYGKMPDYEHIFTDFLLSLVQNKYKKRPTT
ncbi:inositol-tetrakisphosphate 1-kinase 4 isoform X2 [Ziziphus jujuba]|uniref:Inositol-tetrakisphosphate 1-kinase n=1 Tax=Ziziphus jujuba TaxID=326968 RepID=A0A6P4AXJ4_ZIZJJ|nr:inositol-tetrakisphosphate 1-kinase 4 isoform X2 [Ziziphus jujuba]